MKAMDVRKSHTVVIYDSGKGFFASRAVFMMRAFGHPKVFLLDGGLIKWKQEGRAIEDSPIAEFEAEFAYELNQESLISYDRVKEASESGSI
mmetsp:Transcript_12431/g.15875  ORF Transcript_12431/g.15875 Transcript_12431/m.15875 type:complete len:92 (-) Transcript_12431:370-645(-)